MLAGEVNPHTRARRYRWGRKLQWQPTTLVSGKPSLQLKIGNEKCVLEPKDALLLTSALLEFIIETSTEKKS